MVEVPSSPVAIGAIGTSLRLLAGPCWRMMLTPCGGVSRLVAFRVREKWPYVAITTCPSNCLLDTGDQTSWDGGEVKAGSGSGSGRILGDSGSDQCRIDEEGVCELHFNGR